MDFVRDYWWLLVLALLAVAAVFLVTRPRQRVRLTDSAPVRPHMAGKPPGEGRGLASEAAAATSDVTGAILRAPVHAELSGGGTRDDLLLLKGVGPKLADQLRALGFDRFEQIAGLSDNEVERLDAQLGAFRGRITRDRIVDQATYLARGDNDGFEQRFGKL